MLITYLDFPNIPKNIQEIIISKALAVKFNSNDYNLTADNETMNQVKQSIPENDPHSLGILFSEAEQYFQKKIAFFGFIPAPTELMQWIKENINIDYRSVNIQVMTGGDFIVPHIDEIRTAGLNYLIESGGDNVETCFYEPKDEFIEYNLLPQTAFPFDRIDKVYSEVIPLLKWHRIETTHIHSVENLQVNRYRISISISL